MHQNADTIKKWAIAGVIISIIVIFIFAMSLSDAKKFRERDICESASTITTVGNKAFLSKSINKSYTVYLIDSGSEYNFGKAKNTFYIVQQTDSGIKAYKVTNSIANKANILAYFNTVKEVNNLPITMIAGGLLAATIIVPMLLGLITVGLWFWWFLLNKEAEKKRLSKAITATSAIHTAPRSQISTPPAKVLATSDQTVKNQRLVDKGIVKPMREEKGKFKPILPLGHPDYCTNIYTKVMRIQNDSSATAGFGEAELLIGIVDIERASKVLSTEEYDCVKQIFDFFDSHWKLNLTYQEYIDKCFDIASHFDMVAPYWKFAGNLFPLKVKFVQQDKDKESYRARAKKLLAQPRDKKTMLEQFPDTLRQMQGKAAIDFSPDLVHGWSELNGEFYDTFYKQGFGGDSILSIYSKQNFEDDNTNDEEYNAPKNGNHDEDEVIIARKDRIAANQTDDKSQISEPNLDIPVSKQTVNKIPSYGLNPNDPICILSIPEEYSYINRLVCVSSDDMIVMRTRIGSVGHKGVMLDKWDIQVRNKTSGEIKKVILFLNPYSSLNDLKVPNGFR